MDFVLLTAGFVACACTAHVLLSQRAFLGIVGLLLAGGTALDLHVCARQSGPTWSTGACWLHHADTAHPSSTKVFVGSQDFVQTVMGSRLSKLVRQRMCPDVGSFSLSMEARKEAVKKEYLLLFGLLTLFER